MYSSISSYFDVEQKLLSMPRFQDVGGRAARFGIDQISEFCDSIGNPQNAYKIIHVAGTNGKGTVCSIIASLLKEAGFKTGLYTSPHLIDVRERFRINGDMIEKDQIVKCYKEFESVLDEYPLTFFELTTAMAFRLFEMEQVDFAVIETGLGGRLDATNVVNPVGCAITSIGFDHMEQLGNSLESIAFEKAGILKKGVPFTVGDVPSKAFDVIINQAYAVNAQKIEKIVDVQTVSDGSLTLSYGNHNSSIVCDLNTPKIEENISIALDLLLSVFGNGVLTSEVVTRGLMNIRKNSGLLGRFEKLATNQDWYFDGGHNPEALKQVSDHLERKFPNRPKNVVISLMSDKLSQEIIELLQTFDQVFFYEIDSPRALKAVDFIEKCRNAKNIGLNSTEIKKNLLELKSTLVLFTGSFYFYSTATEWMESLSLDSN
jgi:dihydrofolate synthase/folylpolyglutamate synthase